jgi:hypothetical protein
MSALGQNGHDGFNLRCPLYLRKRTSLSAIAMSAKCQEQTQALQQSAASRQVPNTRVTTASIMVIGCDG